MSGRPTDSIERERSRREGQERRRREARIAHREQLLLSGLLRAVRARPSWYDQAACKGNTEIMFDTYDHERGLAICATCEVREPCRAQGRADREQGTWGGETEIDRARIGRGSSLNVTATNRLLRERREASGR